MIDTIFDPKIWLIFVRLGHTGPGVILGSDSNGAQCNGDFVTHPSSTVCPVNLSN